MTLQQSQSTVIFVQSTAHWEAIQQQRAQSLGYSSPTTPTAEPIQARIIDKKQKQQTSITTTKRPSRLIGKEGTRRRNRWTNSTFSDHPSAVLYADDLRPPGYETKAPKYDIGLISNDQEEEEHEIQDHGQEKLQVLPHNLSRHDRYDLKKAHISKGLVTNYESQLIRFIDNWLNDTQCLENACLEIQVASNNQFERYVLHTMCRYYGFSSFSKTNEQNQRVTYIFHSTYVNYVTEHNTDIDYSLVEDWVMPEKSFFEYLFPLSV